MPSSPDDGARLVWAGFHHGPVAKVEVRREGGTVTAVIHASPHLLVKGGLVAWLGAWAVGELLALRFATAAAESVLPLFHGFSLAFLAGWTLVGLLAAWNLLWCLEGTEELASDGFEFTFRRQVRGVGRTRRFPRGKVKNLWTRYDGAVLSPDEVPPDAPVRIGFDVGWHTYRINASLRHADAQQVLAAFGRGPAAQPRPDRQVGGSARGGEARPPPLPSR
jgi:hypothetical protein